MCTTWRRLFPSALILHSRGNLNGLAKAVDERRLVVVDELEEVGVGSHGWM